MLRSSMWPEQDGDSNIGMMEIGVLDLFKRATQPYGEQELQLRLVDTSRRRIWEQLIGNGA